MKYSKKNYFHLIVLKFWILKVHIIYEKEGLKQITEYKYKHMLVIERKIQLKVYY